MQIVLKNLVLNKYFLIAINWQVNLAANLITKQLNANVYIPAGEGGVNSWHLRCGVGFKNPYPTILMHINANSNYYH